jgi:hypothetical protein
MLVAMVVAFTHGAASQPVTLPSRLNPMLEFAKALRPGWIALALILSFASVKLSSRLVLRRS